VLLRAVHVGVADVAGRDEARDRLATVYAGFEEGFDTERLCDARVMLGRLTNG